METRKAVEFIGKTGIKVKALESEKKSLPKYPLLVQEFTPDSGS
jgi:hypothetical protein